MKRKTQAYKELVKVLNFKRQKVSAPSPPMKEFTPELLRELRMKAKLTQVQLARYVGLYKGTISNYENNKYKPSSESWQDILEVLMNKDMRHEPELEIVPKPVNFTFEEGHCYTIRDIYAGKIYSDVNPATGKKVVFRYEGMKGIHHCFREARGGWHRTFTNAQLIGKQIKEVAYD